jgi:O-antigen/teichoic acid export membrane protein
MLISALINLGLNFVLVPEYGIIGAAIATLIGYVSYVVMIIPRSFKYISYRPDFGAIWRSLLYGVAMFIVMNQFHISNRVGSLLGKGAVGMFVYLVLVLAFERDIREKGLKYLSILRGYETWRM